MTSKKSVAETKRLKPSGKADRIELRLSAAEKQGFSAAAELSAISLSSWIRLRLRVAAKNELEHEKKHVPF